MVTRGSLLKSVLVVVFMLAAVESGEKLATCCRKVNRREITEPITGFMVQKASRSCVPAVIFQTEKGLFCSQVNAPWVKAKISAFKRAKVRTRSAVPSSTASLLSIITSSASPPSSSIPFPSSSSSSSSLPSFSSTSWTPADETLSENDDE
uniref:Chemokine interleukin-8-like domain-containing protein n=1 Tax=Mola mola TaxID=94237 RepID=A0A3Q3W8T6_MOLML